MSIHWYPGHMHKATKEIKEILPKIDIVIEVVDARLPYSSENPVIQAFASEKPTLKILNKTDLADPNVTEAWEAYFQGKEKVEAITHQLHQGGLLSRFQEACYRLAPHKKDKADPIRALITGIPNVGKSTIINTLADRIVAKTGNEPAVTKTQQRINIEGDILLYDTPGILWPKIENEKSSYRLATTGAIKDTALEHDDVAFFAIGYLMQAYPELIKKRYLFENIPASEVETLEAIGKKRGCLAARGAIDFDKVAKVLLNDIRAGKLGNISWETPEIAVQEMEETRLLMEKKAEEKAAKKAARKAKAKKKR